MAALLTVLGACTADDPGPSPAAGSSSPAPVVAGVPVPGGTLRLGLERVVTFDPAAVSPGSQSELMAADLLFDGLTDQAPGAPTAAPRLAATVEPSRDFKAWTFTLREDARFSDGTPVTAADVKFSFERLVKRGDGSLAAVRLEIVRGYDAFRTGVAEDLAGIRVLDDLELSVTLDVAYALLPELLAGPAFGIVPRAAVEAPAPPFASAPVGSGPFAFAGGTGDVVRLLRSQNGSAALLDGIELHQYDDLDQAFDDFTAGDLDWSLLSGDTVEAAAAQFGTGAFRPFHGELFYAFNLLDPAFVDPRFRLAIVQAIDRGALVKAVYPGVAEPLNGVVPAGVPGHVPNACGASCTFDPVSARALLAQAFPDGAVPTVHLDYSEGQSDAAVAGAIESGLTAVGIPVVKRPLPPSQYADFAFSGQQGLFQLGWIGVAQTADAYLTPLFKTKSAENVTGFTLEETDDLLDEAHASGDAAARAPLFQQAEQQILAQIPVIPIAQFSTRAVGSPRVRGLDLAVDGTFAGESVWLAR